ncbi:MAG: N-acetyl-gamma-glutamyl-phosphate reductase [Actinomycetota bacterium]|nr:N-acetyl-gamma-glutamyl-phosphate reductase [Actinomycetota bacterium]
MSTTVKILGASGYGGGEMARLVADHPSLDLAVVAADRRAGQALAAVHPHLAGAGDIELIGLEEGLGAPAQVCFSCLPSGELGDRLPRLKAGTVIDLSDEFRAGRWLYGLTEFVRDELPGASTVANPGCYPTAALLCLLPFARAGRIDGPVIIDAISGVSGAGRRPADHLLFSAGAGNVTAYGPTDHRHIPEIERGLSTLGGLETTVSFTPHLAPMPRGILVTARANLRVSMDDGDALEILGARYGDEQLIEVIEGWPATKPVAGTGRAHVSARVDARNRLLIASAAIDNLGKGAAAQALQNANVILGMEETAGLGSYGMWP